MIHGGCSIALRPGTDIRKFLLRLRNGLTEKFVQVLEQAGAVGASIERRPYSEFLKEIKQTGASRVESHGYGLFIGGRLNFYPLKQTAFTRLTENKKVLLTLGRTESSRLN
jgi:hypothetical protein